VIYPTRRLLPVIAALLVLLAAAAASADEDVEDFRVPVSADASLAIRSASKADVLWLETDETEGIAALRFRDARLADLPPSEPPFLMPVELTLELWVSDVTDAASADGLVVTYGGVEIGRHGAAQAGERIRIPLDPVPVVAAEDVVLVLRGAGPDGLAVASRASGRGAELRVVVFRDRPDPGDEFLESPAG